MVSTCGAATCWRGTWTEHVAVEIAYIDYRPSELLTKRMHAKLAREALRRAAHHHVQVRLGKHFQNVPETEPGGVYGYLPRTAKHQARKQQKFGHNLPNVYTGRERNQIRNQSRIAATQYRSTLYLKRTHTREPQASLQHRREILAISLPERIEIQRQVHEWYLEQANKPENQRQRAPKQRI